MKTSLVLVRAVLILVSSRIATGQYFCSNSCHDAYDGFCDDGGPGSAHNLCAFGTDCADCGTRFTPTTYPTTYPTPYPTKQPTTPSPTASLGNICQKGSSCDSGETCACTSRFVPSPSPTKAPFNCYDGPCIGESHVKYCYTDTNQRYSLNRKLTSSEYGHNCLAASSGRSRPSVLTTIAATLLLGPVAVGFGAYGFAEAYTRYPTRYPTSKVGWVTTCTCVLTSLVPTEQPTRFPSTLPSSSPSMVPTTEQPTWIPSTAPSSSPIPPSLVPTEQLTWIPSTAPSSSPIPRSSPSPTESESTTRSLSSTKREGDEDSNMVLIIILWCTLSMACVIAVVIVGVIVYVVYKRRRGAREQNPDPPNERAAVVVVEVEEPAPELFPEQETELCCICSDEPKNTVFIPCGHLCVCDACSARVMNLNAECPLCRGRVDTTQRVY